MSRYRKVTGSNRNTVLVSAGMAFLFSMAGTLAVAETVAPASYRVPIRQWVETYAEYFSAHKLEVNSTLDLPSLWLFSPDGAMTQLVTPRADPDLKKFNGSAPFKGDQQQLVGMPTRAQMREVLGKALGKEAMPEKTAAETWYAVLFLSDSLGCSHCAGYDKQLAALEQRMPGQLRVVRVTAEFTH